jgi:hypothetical protein
VTLATIGEYVAGGGGSLTVLWTVVRWAKSRTRLCFTLDVDEWRWELQVTKSARANRTKR